MHLISAQNEKQIKDSDSEDTNQLSASMYDISQDKKSEKSLSFDGTGIL